VKKVLVVLLALVLCLTALTGCSRDEVGFYNLTKDMSQMQAYNGSGEMTMGLDMTYVSSLTGQTMTAEEKAILEALKNIKMTYSVKCDVAKSLSEIELAFVISGKTYDLGKIYMDSNSNFYFDSEKTLALAAPFISDADLQQAKKLVAEGKWLKIDLLAAMGDDVDIASMNKWAQDYLKTALGAGDKFVNEIAKDYSSGLIQKSGSGYEFVLTDENVLPFIQSFGEFGVNNIDAIGAWYKELFAEPSMQSYMELIGITEMSVEEFNAAIDEMVAMVNADKENILAQLSSLDGEEAQAALAMIDGSKIRYFIGKSGSNYNDEYEMIIKVQEGSLNYFSMDMQVKETYKPVTSVNIDIPTEGVVDVAQIIEENASEQVAFIHSADCEQYIYKKSVDLFGGMTLESNSGEINIKMINDRAYLPLRLTCELLGATVDWDQTTQKASIKTDKFSGKVEGKVINNLTYIPIRQFENYGYTVVYDTNTSSSAYQDLMMSFWGEEAAQYLIIVTK